MNIPISITTVIFRTQRVVIRSGVARRGRNGLKIFNRYNKPHWGARKIRDLLVRRLEAR
jgi:hypothetical protein